MELEPGHHLNPEQAAFSLRFSIFSQIEKKENSGKTSRNHTFGLKLAPDKWCKPNCSDRRVMRTLTWRSLS